MSFTEVALDALIESAPLERAGGRDMPILSMTMHEGLVDQASKFKKRVASTDTADYKLVHRNQLVVGFPIDEGVLSFQDLYDAAIVSPAYDIWNLRRTHEIEPTYLERFLRSPRALAFYRTKLRGTTARRRTLPDDIFLNLPVPLPSPAEQRRIAAILDKADELRAKRRAALARLDSLTQSIFLDMFGDPVTNDRGWPSNTVGYFIAGFETGKNLVADDEDDDSDGLRVLKVSAVTSLRFRPEESKALPPGYVPPPSHFVRKGDLLFSRANTQELIGATALVDHAWEGLVLPDKLWRFLWHDEPRADPRFVHWLFRQPKLRFELGRRATGTSRSMKNISQEKVLDIKVGLPELPLQREFGRIAYAIDRLRQIGEEALSTINSVFISLQYRAFRGEL